MAKSPTFSEDSSCIESAAAVAGDGEPNAAVIGAVWIGCPGAADCGGDSRRQLAAAAACIFPCVVAAAALSD